MTSTSDPGHAVGGAGGGEGVGADRLDQAAVGAASALAAGQPGLRRGQRLGRDDNGPAHGSSLRTRPAYAGSLRARSGHTADCTPDGEATGGAGSGKAAQAAQARARREAGPGWRFVWLVLYYPVSGLVRSRYRNIERIPQQGPVIIVVNHVSHVDPFLVAKFVLDAARVPRFLAKESIFERPGRRLGHAGHGPHPGQARHVDARQSLAAAVDALRPRPGDRAAPRGHGDP